MCISEHPKHPLVPHGDLRTAVLMLIAGSKHDQKNVEDAIETVRRMSERIEASVQVSNLESSMSVAPLYK